MESLRSLADVYRAVWPDCLRLCMVSALVLSALGLILVPYRDEILDVVAGLFLPADWLASFHMANRALFHQLGGVVLFQTVAILCFSTISVFFFPFRDRISILAEMRLTGLPIKGSGLRQELWLEAGLVMIAFNFYSVSYLLAYFVGQPLFGYIDELAFLLLIMFFIVDLLSLSYFRRNMNCLYVLRALRAQPVKLLLFGIVFCSPIFALELFLGDLVYNQENNLVLAVAMVAIVVLNCIVCVFALPMGAWLALGCVQQHDTGKSAGRIEHSHKVFFGSQLIFLCGLLLFYGSIIGVLSNKVPLKSADYAIQWMTLDYQSGTGGDSPSLRFDMQIFNRHETLGLEVDNATLLVNLDGRYLGEAGLTIPYVAPNTAVVVPVELKLHLDIPELAGIASEEFFSMFTPEQAAWRDTIQARLMVPLPLGLQLPIYITEGYRHEFQEK
ncbi:MAG: hypothetical protein V7709_12965 [Halioglobus sp.]